MHDANSKIDTSALILILVILVLSRITLYFIFGTGFVDSDAKMRYLPQVDALSQSFGNLFSQIGPAYSLFLLFFKKVTSDMVISSVAAQHTIGVITGVLVFQYFKKVNLFLAAFITIFVYAGWLALWLEHTILRDSLTAFFLVLLILIYTLTIKQEKYFKLIYAVLAGFMGLILVLFRVEHIVLVIFLPLVFFIARTGQPLHFKFRDKRFFAWCFGYFLPLFAFLLVSGAILKNQEQKKLHYGSFFDTAYYSMAYNDLLPRIFDYDNSRYPGLLEKYRLSLETNRTELNNLAADRRQKTNKTLDIVLNDTKEYLSEHPEMNLSVSQLTDLVYLEIIEKNTLVFLQGVVVNFKEHLVGMAEMHSVLAKSGKINLLKVHLSGTNPRNVKDVNPASLFDKVLMLYFKSMIMFGRIMFWLFLISLPILFVKWKTTPVEVIVSLFVVFLHLSVLAIVVDPSHRFRYPIDPFLYFLQFYLIVSVFKIISFKNFKLERVLRNNGSEK